MTKNTIFCGIISSEFLKTDCLLANEMIIRSNKTINKYIVENHKPLKISNSIGAKEVNNAKVKVIITLPPKN